MPENLYSCAIFRSSRQQHMKFMQQKLYAKVFELCTLAGKRCTCCMKIQQLKFSAVQIKNAVSANIKHRKIDTSIIHPISGQ